MDSLLKAEQQAARLRHHLRIAQLPELKILCGLRFFKLFSDERYIGLESYIREFVPSLAVAARKSNTTEFLPEEAESLTAFVALLEKQETGAVLPDDLAALKGLADSIAICRGEVAADLPKRRSVACVTCLFVEYYPDLDLPPRGRLLNLHVTASAISAKADNDDIVVRNPVSEPDDRFLEQARDSVRAARSHLHNRYDLSPTKRYRFDFAVDSTGARFTGDSLGVAFAVGAVAAVAKIEVFIERLTVSPDVAFSGALFTNGMLAPIDTEALKLKIYRAFHSGIKCLVIPREHMTDAQACVSELEKQCPERKLELLGADTFESVASDPQLVRVERSSPPVYLARKVWKVKRSRWVEVPALLVLASILAFLLIPDHYMPWFDDNPAMAFANPANNSIEAFNRDSVLLWSDTLSCVLSKANRTKPNAPGYGHVRDFDGDGRNEVVIQPLIDEDCEERSWIRFYSSDGRLLFKRFAPIMEKTPVDTNGVLYDAAGLYMTQVASEPVLISQVVQELPARMHIRMWSGDGDSLGWYIHWGHGSFQRAIDLDSDGEEELLFVCYYNRMGCAALLALTAESAHGISPLLRQSGRKYDWLTPGNQYGYVLFPVTDIGQVPGELPPGYNFLGPNGIQVSEKGLLKIYISESFQYDEGPQIIYFLDHRLRVVKVSFSDILRNRRKELVAEGKLAPIEDWSAYIASIRDNVTYWIDSGWVTEGQLRAAETSQ